MLCLFQVGCGACNTYGHARYRTALDDLESAVSLVSWFDLAFGAGTAGCSFRARLEMPRTLDRPIQELFIFKKYDDFELLRPQSATDFEARYLDIGLSARSPVDNDT